MKMKFFELAKKLSKKSEYYQKLGAVIVKKGDVIGVGFNKPKKTHPRSNTLFRTIHAELDAILNAGEELVQGCDIYIYREHRSGVPAISKPCKFCEKLLKEYGIKNIYFTNNGSYSNIQTEGKL